jgi:hypothetical protein
MPSSIALLEPYDLTFYEETASDGKLKTHNVPPTRVQRSVVTDRGGDNPNFKTQVLMTTCVHGFYEKGIPATLIVFEYQLSSNKSGHEFKSACTMFEFNDAPGSGKKAVPSVIAYAPFRHPVQANRTIAEIGTSREAGLAIGAAAIATANIDVRGSKEVKHKQKYFDEGKAGRHYDEDSDRFHKVWWKLQQNSSQRLGIPGVFRVAVLLTRKTMPTSQ